LKEIGKNDPDSFLTFYVWMQRVGLIPETCLTMEQLLNSDIAVIINPVKEWDPKDLYRLKSYVADGGKLLVMDSTMDSPSTSRQILSLWDIGFSAEKQKKMNNPNPQKYYDNFLEKTQFSDRETSPTLFSYVTEPDKNLYLVSYLSVVGGKALLKNKNEDSILSILDYGNGKVMVFGSSHIFNDTTMGETSVVPNKYQWDISKLEFFMCNILK
jgi:hypothetical protein